MSANNLIGPDDLTTAAMAISDARAILQAALEGNVYKMEHDTAGTQKYCIYIKAYIRAVDCLLRTVKAEFDSNGITCD